MMIFFSTLRFERKLQAASDAATAMSNKGEVNLKIAVRKHWTRFIYYISPVRTYPADNLFTEGSQNKISRAKVAVSYKGI